MSRPAADAQEFRQLFGGKLCGAPGYRLSVEKSAEGDLARLERPSSESDIGRNRRRLILPAPVWRVASSGGTAEPVRMN